MQELIKAVWKQIKTLDFPNVSEFSNDYKGTMSFIESIIDKK
jgi:hypothetical protein